MTYTSAGIRNADRRHCNGDIRASVDLSSCLGPRYVGALGGVIVVGTALALACTFRSQHDRPYLKEASWEA